MKSEITFEAEDIEVAESSYTAICTILYEKVDTSFDHEFGTEKGHEFAIQSVQIDSWMQFNEDGEVIAEWSFDKSNPAITEICEHLADQIERECESAILEEITESEGDFGFDYPDSDEF